ncbi:MAG: hypothetical protein QXF04_02455 [Candidatus Aenigmatarchaeota archaeon]|nr:hypothetical protein [Candidatus Aenigmarchaeota archaeon]
MHPLVKSFIGIIIAVLGVYYIFKGIPFLGISPALEDVKIVLNGAIPILAVILGIFIAWLYYDEWKIEKELKRELEKEEKEAEEKKKSKKKKE